jgi:hypothetical protein
MTASYYVSHGCAAALSCCGDTGDLRPARGEAVVIQSARGPELGTVLSEAIDRSTSFSAGEILRRATADDHRAFAELRRRGQLLLDHAHQLIQEQYLPLLPLDVDLTLDGAAALIHVLRWEPCTLTPLLEELHRRHPFAIQLLDTSSGARSASKGSEDHHGCGSCGSCGSGGCGSGGCDSCGSGCGSGDCSRGAAPSAAELTAYFANLRAQMEAANRVPLL